MFSFYVELERRSGNPTHEHHPRLYHPDSAPVPICLLTEQKKEPRMSWMPLPTKHLVECFYYEGLEGILTRSNSPTWIAK